MSKLVFIVLFWAAVLVLSAQLGLLHHAANGGDSAWATYKEGQSEADNLPSSDRFRDRTPRMVADMTKTMLRYGTFTHVLAHAPFPYSGKYEDSNVNFFDYIDPQTGQRFHTNRYGERFSEHDHYGDGRVLFHIPPHFDPERPFVYVVFFHGIFSEVRQCVRDYRLDEQIDKSGKNVILVAPQLAKNAADSSPGKLFRRSAFRAMMQEVAGVLARRLGNEHRAHLEGAPILLVAFSGGYKAVGSILDRGGTQSRIKGVVLFDALYADVEKFEKWIRHRSGKAFLIDIFTTGACEENSRVLSSQLLRHQLHFSTDWPSRISKRGIYLIRSETDHMRIPIEGPPSEPLKEILRNLRM